MKKVPTRVDKTALRGDSVLTRKSIKDSLVSLAGLIGCSDARMAPVMAQVFADRGDRVLVVRGKQSEDENRVYLHRGIAARQFQRTFVLADGMEVTGARLENGLLELHLERPEPRRVVRRIQIGG